MKPHTIAPAVIAPFEDQFIADQLDLTKWVVTPSEKLPGSTIDIVNRGDTKRWLRLRLDTTRQGMMHGVCTQEEVVDFSHRTEVNFTLDWNNVVETNGMAAGIYLCSDAKSAAPGGIDSPQYIKVMYYGGHFDGSKARLEITVQARGVGDHTLYDEGYEAYTQDTTGKLTFTYRTIGIQHIRLIVDENEITVWENDKQVCHNSFKALAGSTGPLPWNTGYLYLQQESSFKRPAREVFFSNIHVRQLSEKPTL
jgi:hypothetical protein